MKLLFQPEATYQTKFEDALPGLLATKQHFLDFLIVFKDLGDSLAQDYAATTANFEIWLGAPGAYKDVTGYQERHTQYQQYRSYYSLLLNACRRKYDFWLNDIIPDDYLSPTKKKKPLKKKPSSTKP